MKLNDELGLDPLGLAAEMVKLHSISAAPCGVTWTRTHPEADMSDSTQFYHVAAYVVDLV